MVCMPCAGAAASPEAGGCGVGAQVKNITRKHLNNPALVDLVGDAQSGKMPEGIKCARAPTFHMLSPHHAGSRHLTSHSLHVELFSARVDARPRVR